MSSASKLLLKTLSKEDLEIVKKRIESFYSHEGNHFIQVARNGCHLLDPSKKTKYPKITVSTGSRVQVKVCHLVIFIRSGRIPGENEDLSHLCHHTKCVNADHLTIESHQINIERKQCRSARKCLGHQKSHHYPTTEQELDLDLAATQIPNCIFAGKLG